MPGKLTANSPAASVPGSGCFAVTHWSMVLRAGKAEAPGATEALEKLCRAYWYPVYAWIRSRGHGPEEAKDLTQEFFAGLLRKDSLSRVEPEKGRFRTWLIRCIQYFLTDQHRLNNAARRGGGRSFVEWDALDREQRYALEPAAQDTPDAAFDRRWSRVLVSRALHRLEEEQRSPGHREAFVLLKEFIGAPPPEGAYSHIAKQLAVTENKLAVTMHRLRLRCRDLIMEEIMQTVQTRSEAEEELRALFGK